MRDLLVARLTDASPRPWRPALGSCHDVERNRAGDYRIVKVMAGGEKREVFAGLL